MRIAFGNDHAGYDLKQKLMPFVAELGHEVSDLGNRSQDPQDDYPDYALAVAVAVARGEADRGIVICGSGVGASVVRWRRDNERNKQARCLTMPAYNGYSK